MLYSHTMCVTVTRATTIDSIRCANGECGAGCRCPHRRQTMKRFKITDGESTSVMLGTLDDAIIAAQKLYGKPRKITLTTSTINPTAVLSYKHNKIVRITPNGDVSAKRRMNNPPEKPAKYRYGACPNEKTRGKVQKHDKGTPASIRIA